MKLILRIIFSYFIGITFLLSGLLSLSHMCIEQTQIHTINDTNVTIETEYEGSVALGHHDETSHDNDDYGCPLHKVCCSVLTLNVPTENIFYRNGDLIYRSHKFVISLNPEPLLDGPFQPPRV